MIRTKRLWLKLSLALLAVSALLVLMMMKTYYHPMFSPYLADTPYALSHLSSSSPSSPITHPASSHDGSHPHAMVVEGNSRMGKVSGDATMADDVISSKTSDVSGPSSASLPSCPDIPPNLVGFKPLGEKVNKTVAILEKEWSKVLKPGGHYHPLDCRPENRTAILIPCRNRWTHLPVLLNHLIPFLIRQQLFFTLFVLESDQASHFNKGLLLNAGFLESIRRGNYTCFVFQDVDMLPLNDYNLYRCEDNPRHLAVAIDRNGYRLPYPTFFGGAIAISKEQFQKINGFSNAFFGWGGEDDDIEHRLRGRDYMILRMPDDMAQYYSIRHSRDKGNERTRQRERLMRYNAAIKRMDVDGFRQAQYQKDWVRITPLFTWVHITVNQTRVIQNFPDHVRNMFKNGLKIVERVKTYKGLTFKNQKKT